MDGEVIQMKPALTCIPIAVHRGVDVVATIRMVLGRRVLCNKSGAKGALPFIFMEH